MAKSQRVTYPSLPLSSAFYQAIAEVGARYGLNLANREGLAEAVAALSHTYTRERGGLAQGQLSRAAPLARLGFFLPRDLVKVFGPLSELKAAERFGARSRLRVLDLGAGLGTTSLGLARFLRFSGSAVERLEVTAIERDAHSVKLMRALCGALSKLPSELVPIDLDVRSADLCRVEERGPFDLILLGFVLNELFLEHPASERPALRAALLRSLAKKLAPDGAVVVLEPALRDSARELMQTRDALTALDAAPSVFAPCVRRGPCPMLQNERDWCHETLDYALPAELIPVARSAGLRYEGLSYAALVLTQQPRFQPEPHLVRIVSERLVSKGKLELFGCSEAGYQRLTRLDREESALNSGFGTLRRGDIAQVEARGSAHEQKLEGVRVTRETHLIKH